MAAPAPVYDYIVVGAGSAGCVLANRLSANPNTSVLLIEAGPPDRSPFIHMPRGYIRLHKNPRFSWYFPVTADAEREWQGALISGMVLGGTSSINSMIYLRGQPEDYDQWAAGGAPGWDWRHIAPCFRQMENHGGGEGAAGPLHISFPRSEDPLSEALIAAGLESGLRRKVGFNTLDHEGIGYFAATIKRGRRMSAAQAFLAPIRKRANLSIATDTLATKIIFEGRRAVGVACIRNGVPHEFRAGKEIIVSTGALQSPKLLQLSGIGPADHLRSLGIDVVCDSPGVGANFLEHWKLQPQYRLLQRQSSYRRARLYSTLLRYYLFRDGVLAWTPSEIGAFVKTQPDADRPDVEFQMSHFPSVVARVSGTPEDRREFYCSAVLLRPESRGTVMIHTTDPAVAPAVRGNFLTADYDRRVSIDMVRYLRRLLRQPALQPHIGEETFPGPDCQSDDEIIDVCRQFGTPGAHFAGTCKMGQDSMAVLDEKLRVRGVAGLRVADASIMPTLVSCNINGPVMAIAWRAADLILDNQEPRDA